jgi:hypothetical protein
MRSRETATKSLISCLNHFWFALEDLSRSFASGHGSAERDRGVAWIASLVARCVHISRQRPFTLWRRFNGFSRLATRGWLGTIYLPGTSERFLAPMDRKRPTSRPILKPDEIELLAACACPARSEYLQIDKRIAELANSARAAHNASIILQEAKRASLVQ